MEHDAYGTKQARSGRCLKLSNQSIKPRKRLHLECRVIERRERHVTRLKMVRPKVYGKARERERTLSGGEHIVQ
jgi:hypothetical protein